MKICGRCYDRDGSVVNAVETVSFITDGDTQDLCLSCSESIREFIHEPKKFDKKMDKDVEPAKRRGRPKKSA